MDTFADTLWTEFAVETDEHLQALEPILAQADNGTTSAAEIAQLFRSFHSIKGLARAMDMLGMESVAHHAENLLGLVRDGKARLDDQVADLLLQSVDALKTMRDSITTERRDAPAERGLIARLESVFERLGGATAGEGTGPAATAASPGGDDSLHEDQEMLSIFVEMLQSRGPELCDALAAEPDARADALDAAESLMHAAEVMNFDALGETFGGLCNVLRSPSCAGPLDETTRQDLLARLGDIRLQIELVGEVSGLDAGVAEFSAALAARIGDDRFALVRSIYELNERLREAVSIGDELAAEADAAAITRLCRTLHSMSAALSQQRIAEIILLIEDLYGRMATGETQLAAPLLDQVDEVLARLAGDATAGDVADFGDEEAADMAARLRSPISPAHAYAPDGHGHLVAGVFVPAELMAVLSEENFAQLEQGLASEGLTPYAVLLHVEADPDAGRRVLEWLTSRTRTITNRTVIDNGESWFEFLALTELEPAAVLAGLTEHDPARHCLKRLRRLTSAPGGEALFGDAAAAAASGDLSPAGHTTVATNLIRVRGEIVDSFLDEIGELRVVVERLTHLVRGASARGLLSRAQSLADRLPRDLRAEFLASFEEFRERDRQLLETEELISGLLGRLHQSALELRVVPVDVVFNRLPRLVRDLAQRQGKSVELVLEGRDVRIDKSMVEALADPLIHMVRNAVDHGIEPPDARQAAGKPARAQLTVRAAQRGTEVRIEVVDDGRGLDPDAIRAKAVARGLATPEQVANLAQGEIFQFIFQPGLSTAATVTETSGRGVGMDIVYSAVRRLNGDVTIRSERGRGTTFTLLLPLSAALQTALIVRIGEQSLAIPERHVMSVAEVERETVHRVGSQRSVVHRDAVLPLYDLATLLGFSDGRCEPDRPLEPVVVTSNGRQVIGLEVDAIEQRLELFLKDLDPRLAQFPGVGGASMLGDGRVVLVLDGDELIQLAMRGVETAPAVARSAAS